VRQGQHHGERVRAEDMRRRRRIWLHFQFHFQCRHFASTKKSQMLASVLSMHRKKFWFNMMIDNYQ